MPALRSISICRRARQPSSTRCWPRALRCRPLSAMAPAFVSATTRSAPWPSRGPRHGRGARTRRTLPAASLPWRDAGFRGKLAVADGRVVHNAGGSEAQELAFVLGVAFAYLRALEAGGVALDAARRVDFLPALGRRRPVPDHRQAPRAAEIVGARRSARAALAPEPAFVAAETAWRMMTQRDPHVNILRATVATFAAALGGADAITVLPFTAARGLPERSARRIARNTQLVLLEEVAPRRGRRPGGRLRRDRGSDRSALPRRLGAVPRNRSSRRHRCCTNERTDPAKSRSGTRQARGRGWRGGRMR